MSIDRSELLFQPRHPLPWFSHGLCAACDKTGHIYGIGSRFQYTSDLFHKECSTWFETINHPCHPEHSLVRSPFDGKDSCGFCGGRMKVGYWCVQCDFKVDMACASKSQPPPESIVIRGESHNHNHTLSLLKARGQEGHCEVCKKTVEGNYPYSCSSCKDLFHVECANLTPEITHPSHPNHPLKLLMSGVVPDYTDNKCLLCPLELGDAFHHCSICNFSICLDCAKDPPPLDLLHLKTHEHTLILMPREISFLCSVCGMQGDRSPWFCLECNFMVHRSCVGLPRVININRHDHRISYIDHVGHDHSLRRCGVCRKDVNRFYGAYSCSVCPGYFVHSHCATRRDVWEGVDLEGVPEDEEIVPPFKVVGENLINHFSHEIHNLRLNKENTNHDDSSRCRACIRPVYTNPVYECEQCDFLLHETCANFPLWKRHVLSNNPLMLEGMKLLKSFCCVACKMMHQGFRYETPSGSSEKLDLQCSSISEPFVHEGHSHPLYYGQKEDSVCRACRKAVEKTLLLCDDCDFALCFRCAVLPTTVRHICDQHLLSLCYDETASGKYWCDICEAETDPKKWFYTCSDCGGTLHAECVLGDFINFMPGSTFGGPRHSKLVLNNKNTRPVCNCCGSRCKVPVIVRKDDAYICSLECVLFLFRETRFVRQQ